MNFLDRIFGRKRSSPEPASSAHVGHIIAFGAKSALFMTKEGVRHTAMHGEHLLWSENDGGFRLVGWGNAIKIDWPEDARLHTEDIMVFQEAFGKTSTAGLRLGYIYQLGPIGEWIFYDPTDTSRTGQTKDQPSELREQWPQPPDDMSLGENSEIHEKDVTKFLQEGIRFQHEGRSPAAKRAYLRCLIGGLAVDDMKIMLTGTVNLVTAYRDEGRPLRAYCLCMFSIMLAKDVPDDIAKFLGALTRDLKEKVAPADQDAVWKIIEDIQWESLPDLIWKLDDYELSRVFERMDDS